MPILKVEVKRKSGSLSVMNVPLTDEEMALMLNSLKLVEGKTKTLGLLQVTCVQKDLRGEFGKHTTRKGDVTNGKPAAVDPA